MNRMHPHPELGSMAQPAMAAIPPSLAAGGLVGLLCREVAIRGCVFAGGLIENLQGDLAAEEEEMITGVVEKRAMEFKAGRNSARLALAQLGYSAIAIPRGESREPLWPDDITGSISHDSTWCVAAAARRHAIAGVGVDIETTDPLDAELANLVCTPFEHGHSQRQGRLPPGEFAKLLFSAKEAVYKCVFPIYRTPLEFEDITIDAHLYMNQYTARVSHPEFGVLEGIRGRFAMIQDRLMTLAVLPVNEHRYGGRTLGENMNDMTTTTSGH